MSNLPKSWKKEKLSDIINLIHGYQFRTNDFTENGIAIIKIGNVNGRTLDLSGLSYISKDRFEEFKQYELNEGDIVMSLTGNIGRVVEVSNLPLKVLQNYRVGKFEAINSNVVFKKYIKFLLSSSIVLDRLETLSNQSAQANFGKQDMDKIFVPLPPLEEQKKIADILSIVDKKIAFVEENINATEELKKALMQKLLTEGIGHTEFKDSELGRIPESWEISNIGNIFNIFVGRDLKEDRFSKEKTDTHIFPVFSNTVDNNGFYGYYDYEEFNGSSLTVVGRGIGVGTAFTKNGSYGAIGRLLVLFPQKGIKPHFYTEYINFKIKIFSESSGIPQLTGAQIKNYKCPIPPLEEQKQIAEILSTVDKKLENLKEKKQSFEELKKGLMQKLLTGEVRV